MKLNKIFYLFMAMAALLLTACTPDKYSMDMPDLQPEDLVAGSAFSVTVDAENTVTLTSLLDERYNCYWIQPNGRSQGREVKLQLPFAGTYEVTFGISTQGGVVYGKPYQFEVTTNNMSLLSDPLYEYLSGGVGCSKKWVPVDRFYGVGQCTAPVMYCNPDDVLNDGSGDSNLGINHMVPNWDPGFQAWLIPADSPYLDSYMIFSLDDINGCSIEEYQGEDGATNKGKWNLNLTDKNCPTLSFTDAYVMHNKGFDGTCDNYTTDIIITELTPYMLQLATMRTNSEGAWWIIWNFIAADVQDGIVEIPSDEVNYIEPVAPVLPEFEDLATRIFTTDINGVEFVGNEMTFTIGEEAAYDWLWWNGGTSAWESVVNGSYGSSWAPMWGDEAYDNELVIGKKFKDGEFQYYTYSYGDEEGVLTIEGSKLIFDDEITFFKVEGSSRTLNLTSKEWQVLKCDTGSELVLGIPDGTDANGATNSYLVANFIYKAVGGATGPTVLPIDQSKLIYGDIEGNGNFRIELSNQYGFNSGQTYNDPPFNADKLKFKNELSITFLLSGLGTLIEPVTATIGCSIDWSFDGSDTGSIKHVNALVNGDGSYTVKLQSDGTKYTSADLNVFVIDILGLANKLDGKDSDYIKADSNTGKCPNVSVTITEMTVD